MGLDIALAIVILIAAVRGWFRGFVIQAIRLIGIVGSVYAAAPIRDLARPYVAPHLGTIRPELLDRLLWWTSAVVTYLVAVGLASLALKMARRRPFGETEPNRTDQSAGFLMGAVKGAIVVAFLVGGLRKYGVDRLRGIDWADEQIKTSYALHWDDQYEPAKKIWTSQPVQHYVAEIRRMGLTVPASGSPPALTEPPPAAQAAANPGPPRLEISIPNLPGLDPTSADFAREFDRAWDVLVPNARPKP